MTIFVPCVELCPILRQRMERFGNRGRVRDSVLFFIVYLERFWLTFLYS
jgi:hypothetical protein